MYEFIYLLQCKIKAASAQREPRGRSPSSPPAPTRPRPAAPTVSVVHSVFFRFLTGLIFWNPQISADYFGFRGTHTGIKSFQGKINLFRNPPESGIWPESEGKDP